MAKEIAREDNEFLADLLSHTPDVRTFHKIVNEHNDKQSVRQILTGDYSKPLRNLPIDPETDKFLPALLAEYDSTTNNQTETSVRYNTRRLNWDWRASLTNLSQALSIPRTRRAAVVSFGLLVVTAGIASNPDSYKASPIYAQTVPTEGPVSTAEIPTIAPDPNTATPEVKPTNTQVPPTEQPSQIPTEIPLPTGTPIPSEIPASPTLPPPPTEAATSTTEPTSFPTAHPTVKPESKPTNTVVIPASATPTETLIPPSAQPTVTPAFTITPIPATETPPPTATPLAGTPIPPQERRRPPSATSTPIPSEVPILPPTEVLTPPTSQPVVPREQPTQVPRMSADMRQSNTVKEAQEATEKITIENVVFEEGSGWDDGKFIKFTSGNGTEVLGAHYYSSEEFLKAKKEALKAGYSESEAKQIALENVINNDEASAWGKLLKWLAENPTQLVSGEYSDGTKFTISQGTELDNTVENPEFNKYIDGLLRGSNQQLIYTCAQDLAGEKVYAALITNLK